MIENCCDFELPRERDTDDGGLLEFDESFPRRVRRSAFSRSNFPQRSSGATSWASAATARASAAASRFSISERRERTGATRASTVDGIQVA